LEREGYQDARAQTNYVRQDDKTGHVFVKIHVDEGPKSMVESVREDFFYEKEDQARSNRTVTPHVPYSKVWAQDFSQALKTNLFHRGYPDTSVDLSVSNKLQSGNVVWLDLEAKVRAGP